jgi:glycerol-3-phosphate dehydrogenase (NAD(P)+)
MKPHLSQNVAIIGAGAWGTALAQVAALAGHKVLMWARDTTTVAEINKSHLNRKRHADIILHPNIQATAKLTELATFAEVLVMALPSETNTSIAAELSKHINAQHVLVISSKGFRENDGAILSDIWREACPTLEHIAILTGPTFAREMLEGKITACIAAATEAYVRTRIAEVFAAPHVRVYESDDIIGAQVGGAIKNILAVAAGILDGLEMGHNARAAMLARGLAEMGRYARVLGGQEKTIWGLAGMGDLLLTATSTMSRNYRFGELVGKGTPVHEAKLRIGTVEGMLAARIVTVQSQAHGLDLAIVAAVDGILHGDITPLKAVDYLMGRPRVMEFEA